MDWTAEAFTLLSRLVAIPSINPGDQSNYGTEYGEQAAGDYLFDYLQQQMPYMKVEKAEVLPNRNNIIAAYHRGENFPSILLETHLDTVDVQGMEINPFQLVEKEGKWYGRGANDAKGQITAMLLGLQKAFQEEGGELPLNILFAATADEEHRHRGVDALVEDVSLKADLAIVGEPTELKVGAFHKGSIRFKVTSHGINAHSSTPWAGENAIDKMADVIQILKSNVREEVESITHPYCGKSAISQNLIDGGEQVNIIPGECTIHVDRRLNPQEDWQTAYAHIKNTVHQELSREISQDITWHQPYLIDPPLSNDLNGHSLITLKHIMKDLDSDFDYTGLQFGCDASKIAPKDIPTVVFGPGSIRQAHTNDEWIDSAELLEAINIYAHIFRSFSKEAGGSNE
jgi:acetylornithine deacetylase